MKLSTILATLASARLPSVTSEQLQHLVGTAEGKAFADDVRWYAAGETERRDQLAAVVHALAPGVRRAVEQLGFQFDVLTVIAAAKRDGTQVFDLLKGTQASDIARCRTITYLQGAGFSAGPAGTPIAQAPLAPSEPPYYSFKIFAGSGALCVSEARTRTGNKHTIQVEGALVLAGGTREYDWRNKITVQLTVQEAYLTLALFENLLPGVKFDGHGRTHDKSLHIEFQASHYYARLTQRGRSAVSVPVRPVDAIPLVSLLYKQLLLNEPHLRIDDIRSMIERMASMARY